ncbi:ribosomal pseudouridine synthase-like protein, partial [Dinothrombium tinctorium]
GQKKFVFAMATFLWTWVFYHCFYDYEHITGEYEDPDRSKFTDEELGIPPDEEGLAPVKDHVMSTRIPHGPLSSLPHHPYRLQLKCGDTGVIRVQSLLGQSVLNAEQKQSDVFGVNDVSKEDVSGIYVGVKFKANSFQLKSETNVKERLVTTSFGDVRFDSSNMIKYHGQLEEDFEEPIEVINDIEETNNESNEQNEKEQSSDENDLSFIDEQYFSSSAINAETTRKLDTDLTNIQHSDPQNSTNKFFDEVKNSNFIDQQYFLPNQDIANAPNADKTIIDSAIFPKKQWEEHDDTDFSFINNNNASKKVKGEMARFDFNLTKEWFEFSKEYAKSENILNLKHSIKPTSKEDDKEVCLLEGIKYAKESPLKKLEDLENELISIKEDHMVQDEPEEIEAIKIVPKEDEAEKVEKEKEPPKTAFEFYKKLKSGEIEPQREELKKDKRTFRIAGEDLDHNKIDPSGIQYDSQGFRNFKEQIVDYSKIRKEEIVWKLKKSIIFDDCDILALDKPYGIVCHGNKSTATAPLLHDLIPDLASLINVEKLYPVHRLDKEATGVLLLAKTQKMASILMTLFQQRKIKKYYNAVTRGVPDQKEGIIDIPMEEGRIDGKEIMILRPDLEENLRRIIKPSKDAKRAVTYYRVKNERGNAALLELSTETGVKHQIRCHLGFGLRTPILGDHKYSNIDKIVPQKLPTDMLAALNVRQSKVRNIPLHLHCKLVIIPELGRNDGNIAINAHLPHVFRRNAKALKLL